MPLTNNSSVASFTVNSSVLNSVNTLTFDSGTNSVELFVDQLPNLVFYVVQTSGASPCTFTPQASLRSTNIEGNTELEYFNLSDIITAPANNVPIILNYQFPVNFIRINFGADTGLGITHTVNYVLAAFGP